MQNTYQVKKVKQPIHWTVEVPGSKSITNRALLLAALTNDEVCLNGVLFSDDSRCFLRSLQSLGFRVDIREENCQVIVKGCGGRIPLSEGEVYVGSAGTAARFLTAMLGVSDGVWRIQASSQMQRRPMKPLFEALLLLGAQIEWLGETWHLPVCITGAGQRLCADADIEGGKTETLIGDEEKSRMDCGPAVLQMDISESTQFLSGFLLIAPMFPGGLRIHITSEKKDGSYIRITRRMMEEFGVTTEFRDGAYIIPAGSSYKRETYQIEPDVSASCYFYAAAAVTGGDALVRHVHRTGMQGDLKFLDVLEQMGCVVCDEPAGIRVAGPGGGIDGTAVAGSGQNEPDDICDMRPGGGTAAAGSGCHEPDDVCFTVSDGGKVRVSGRDSPDGDWIHNGTKDGLLTIFPGKLHGITVDMNDFSDQALTLAAIAPYADAPVRITNIAHIRRQESDRIHAIVSNLERAGIACEEYPDGVKIFPGQPRGCRIETFDDHRVAMAFAVMGLRADGIEIENPGCCRKTFEKYFEILDDFYKR
ncbi:MAG: 3-phosphoshikimate 1-carboxyvinyltransferase [Clostridiales bacterium]|nr:3-phosphoshikimate 1-carboxyvinyltransferase [Clostridiales bacterium]